MAELESKLEVLDGGHYRTQFKFYQETFINCLLKYKQVGRKVRNGWIKSNQKISDIAVHHNRGTKYIFTGSFFEGMPEEICGDRDYMFHEHDAPTVVLFSPDRDDQQFKNGYVIAISSDENPCFVLLNTPSDIKFSEESDKLFSKSITSDGFNLLRNDIAHKFCGNKEEIIMKMVQSAKDAFCKFGTTEDEYELFVICSSLGEAFLVADEPHGPAAASYDIEGDTDRVPCLPCPVWPPCAEDFITRNRKSDWPPQNLIDKIQQSGCHVVPVAHPQSKNPDVEWRWSFSVAERELLMNIPDPAFQAYYAMKAIKKKLWKEHATSTKTTFCSYFIKTAVLWISENYDTTEETPLAVIHHISEWLVQAYSEGVLPHFFIPEQNLIKHMSQGNHVFVLQWLRSIEVNMCKCLLDSLDLPSDMMELCKTIESHDEDVLIKHRSSDRYDRYCTRISPGGDLFQSAIGKMYGMYSWPVFRDLKDLKDPITQLFPDQTRTGQIKIEDIFLPQINDLIENEISLELQPIFKVSFMRLLGNIYHMFSWQISEAVLQDQMLQKAVEYYTRGLEMIHPDGWSDRGIVGHAFLAVLYYQHKKWDKLGEILNKVNAVGMQDIAQERLPHEASALMNSANLCNLSTLLDNFQIDEFIFLLDAVYVHSRRVLLHIEERFNVVSGVSQTDNSTSSLRSITPLVIDSFETLTASLTTDSSSQQLMQIIFERLPSMIPYVANMLANMEPASPFIQLMKQLERIPKEIILSILPLPEQLEEKIQTALEELPAETLERFGEIFTDDNTQEEEEQETEEHVSAEQNVYDEPDLD